MFNERIIRIEDVNLNPLKEMITFQKALSVLSRRIGQWTRTRNKTIKRKQGGYF